MVLIISIKLISIMIGIDVCRYVRGLKFKMIDMYIYNAPNIVLIILN